MNAGMYLVNENDELIEMSEQPYDSEALLQKLLATHPSLLAGNQINPTTPRHWLLIAREAPLPSEQDGANRWSVDHLFLDQDAIPTIVEVKRSSDTRIRREVVGQMLDYAANGVAYWPVERIRAMFEGNCAAQGKDPQVVMQEFLVDNPDPDNFWQQVKTNLQAGRLRMIFVADLIPPELQRVVEFLNSQMDPAEVLAVEIRQFTGGSLRTLVPRVLGRTAVAEQKKSVAPEGGGKRWDEPSLLAELELKYGPAASQVARNLLEWAKVHMSEQWWGYGSFIPGLVHNGIWHQIFGVWSSGRVDVRFQYMKNNPPFDDEALRRQLLDRLNAVPGIQLPADSITRRPGIPLTTLAPEDTFQGFVAVLNWFVERVTTS